MLHSVQSFFYFLPKCLFSVRLDSPICFADRGEEEEDWYVRGDIRFMNFTSFCYYFFICYFFRKLFFFLPTTFTHSHDPHPYPRPTTHDSRSNPLRINPVEQVRIKPSLAIPDQPSPTSPDQPSLASPDQTQSRRSSSNPVEPVQINPV